jgi:hypothetical protein
MSRICGPKREDVAERQRKLHDEELLYILPNIIRVITSSRMGWTELVACVGEV